MELSNPQDETFCASIVAGVSATKSAAAAGHVRGAANFGARLLKRPEIQQRIIELRANSPNQLDENGNVIRSAGPSQGVLIYTEKPWIVTELVATQRLARKLKDISGAHQCLRTLAQIGGLLDGNKGVSGDPTARLALLGVAEIHQMLRSHLGTVPAADRRKLLAEAPELAELVSEVDAAESTPPEGV